MQGSERFVALAVIGGGAYYLVTSGALDGLLHALGIAPQGRSTVALTPQQRATVTEIQAAETAALQSTDQFEATERARSAAGAYAFASAGAATAGSIALGAHIAAGGATGSLALSGYGAAAAVLVWGITQKGWFRGGEEGIYVNPARDKFIQPLIDTYYPGSGSDKQFDAMARALGDAGVNGIEAQSIIAQLYAADTMDEFKVAATRFLQAMKEGLHLA